MKKQELFSTIDKYEQDLRKMALTIWEYAETAMKEHRSSKLQKEYLEEKGFTIKEVPNMETAFIAEFGQGKPVIGLLGEYDALPQLSQKVQAVQETRDGVDAGHGCGHNLLGTGCLGAALAVKEAMERENIQGTLRYYGCPAEETLSGKVLMAKEKVFDDLDAVLAWHPAQMNAIWGCSFLAMNSLTFHFSGIPAHAAAAPEAGRSALDGVELMDVGANFLREHVIDAARIHYTITNGGGAPNTVPAEAEVWYYVRAPKRDQVREITERLVKIAEGAALMTETKVKVNFLAGCYDVIVNKELSRVLFENMKLVGGPTFSEEDKKFAQELYDLSDRKTIENVMKAYFAPKSILERVLVDDVITIDDADKVMAGSVDGGDVSYIAPFTQMTAATWPVGVPSHSWMASAASGSGIGLAAMIFSAKSLAGAVYDMFKNPEKVDKAKKEFEQSLDGFTYVSPYDE